MGVVKDLNRETDKKILATQSTSKTDTPVLDLQGILDGAVIVAIGRETGGMYSVTVDIDVNQDTSSGGDFSTNLTTLSLNISAGDDLVKSQQISSYNRYLQVNNITVSGDGTEEVAVLVIGGSQTS